MLHRIGISNGPVEIYLNDDNKTVAKFSQNDTDDINNFKCIDYRILYIPTVLLTDFEYLCLGSGHVHMYEHDEKGEWIKMTEDCDCTTRKYVWCKKDLHLRIGKDVANRAKKAINILQKLGYYYSSINEKDDSIGGPIIRSYDDFMKFSSKRLFILGDILYNIMKLGEKFPYHLFGLFNHMRFIYDITHMIYGDSKIYFIRSKNEKFKLLYCINCNKSGHTIDHCYKMSIKCFKCNRFGHLIKECKKIK